MCSPDVVLFLLEPEAATRGVLVRKGVLRNFTKLTGKHLCQSLFFNKVAGMQVFLFGYFIWVSLKLTIYRIAWERRQRF